MENKNILADIKNLDIKFKLRQGTINAVNGVSFFIEKRKIIGLVGESGCGKSITSKSLLRIESPAKICSGEIFFNSIQHGKIAIQNLNPHGNMMRSIRWREISMIFQEPMSSFGPMHTIGNQISESIHLHFKVSKKESLYRTLESLKSVGMPRPDKIMKQYPHQLSGGMRQRAMIAMALSCQPNLLIADEPTTALDVSTEAQILDLLFELQKEMNMSVLFITHNLGVITKMADYVIVMYLGRIVEQAGIYELFERPKHPYTYALLNALPRLNKQGKVKKLETLEGSIPNPYDYPDGCAFHTRCPKFMPGICDVLVPESINLHHNTKVACHLYSSSRKS